MVNYQNYAVICCTALISNLRFLGEKGKNPPSFDWLGAVMPLGLQSWGTQFKCWPAYKSSWLSLFWFPCCSQLNTKMVLWQGPCPLLSSLYLPTIRDNLFTSFSRDCWRCLQKVYVKEGWLKVEEGWFSHSSRWIYSSVLVCAFLYPLLKTFFTQDHVDFWLAMYSGKMTWCV